MKISRCYYIERSGAFSNLNKNGYDVDGWIDLIEKVMVVYHHERHGHHDSACPFFYSF